MNIKRIIREELDGLEWIKDTKSNQDIAQEIADETKIKNGKLYPPFSVPPFTHSHFRLFLSLSRSAFASLVFRNYGKEQYGLNKEDANDVWERYKDIIKDKINDHNNLNESSDLQWIKDTNSNQDIAQEIADKTKIKNGKLYPPFLSPAHTLPPFTSHLTHLFLPLPLHPLPHFAKYGKEQYGLDKEDANDVWKRYGKLLKNKINNLKESNDLQWIKNVKSNQDIAQEIADETKIKDNRLYHPPFLPSLHLLATPQSHPLFRKYCKVEYGLDKEDANDVWKRYKKLLKNKVNNLNESNDFSWIDEIPTYDFHNGKYYIDISGLDEDEACEVQQTILNMGIDWKDSMGLQKRFCDTYITKGYIIQNATLYRTPRTFKEYEEAIYPDMIYINGRTDLLS